MLAPSAETMNTGSRLCTSSDDVSMSRLTTPRAQMPRGTGVAFFTHPNYANRCRETYFPGIMVSFGHEIPIPSPFPFRLFRLFALILVASAASLTAHSGNRVYYTIEPQSDSTLLVRVTLHEHDLAGLLAREQACAPSQDLTICAVELIRTKMSVTINGTSNADDAEWIIEQHLMWFCCMSSGRPLTYPNHDHREHLLRDHDAKASEYRRPRTTEDVMYSLTKDRTSDHPHVQGAP